MRWNAQVDEQVVYIILSIADAVGGRLRLASENKQIMFKTAKFWYVQTKLAL